MNGIFDDDSEENSPRNIQKFPSLNVDQLRWKMPIANQRNHGILQQKLVKLRERSMVVSINGLPNSWMVSGKIHGKSYSNGWFGWGYTPILGKKQMVKLVKTGGNFDFTWDETFGFTDSQLTRGRSQLWESSDPTVNVSWCFREHLPSGKLT